MSFEEKPGAPGDITAIMDSFECIDDTFILNQESFDNALASVHNSMAPLTIEEDYMYPTEARNGQSVSLRDNLMQHLTNLRFRFNDGDFIKHMAYPEVKLDGAPVIMMNETFRS